MLVVELDLQGAGFEEFGRVGGPQRDGGGEGGAPGGERGVTRPPGAVAGS